MKRKADKPPTPPSGKTAKRRKSDLSGARVSYGAVLVFSVCLVLFIGGTLAYALFITALLLLPLSLLHAYIASRSLKLLQKAGPQSLQKGQAAIWRFVLRNNSILPIPWIEAIPRECPDLPEALPAHKLSLLPLAKAERSVTVGFRYRGEYSIGMDYIAVYDALRLFRFKLRAGEPLCVRVYPRLLDLRRFPLIRLVDSERPRPAAQDSDEPLSETRKYIPGDTLSRIHWNLTARNQELTSRLFAKESEMRVLCLLDLRPFESPDMRLCEDALIEAGLAGARFVLAQSITLMFVFASGDNIFAVEERDMSRFENLYHACAALRFDAELPPHLLPARLPEARHVLLFTCHDVTEDFLQSVPPDASLNVFRVKRYRDEPVPYSETTHRVRVIALTADGDFASEMEGAGLL